MKVVSSARFSASHMAKRKRILTKLVNDRDIEAKIGQGFESPQIHHFIGM